MDIESVPIDFLSFLLEIGSGEIGKAAYMIYGDLLVPEEIFGESPPSLDGVVIFGDDFQGFSSGYRIKDWVVVEIDSTNMSVHVVAADFQSFIREAVKAVG